MADADLVRTFRKPDINFEAQHYQELTDLTKAAESGFVEHPFLKVMSCAELNKCLHVLCRQEKGL